VDLEGKIVGIVLQLPGNYKEGFKLTSNSLVR
jgi:hypothetical protein